MNKTIKIGTRGSKLALWQANLIKSKLTTIYPGTDFKIIEIKTQGDKILDTALSKIGDKGLFTKELEDALLKNDIDLAVHSLKDLPTQLPEGLKIGGVIERENPCDVLIIRDEKREKIAQNFDISLLPKDFKIGTTSLRRSAQIKHLNPQINCSDLRGNVDTRIRKLKEAQYDAIVLAYAGIKRLYGENLEKEFPDLIFHKLSPKDFLPAVSQGIIGIEIRESDTETENLLSKITHEETSFHATAERSFLATLEGGCQTPIGVYSENNKDNYIFHGMLASTDGKILIKESITCKPNKDILSYENIGKILGEKILRQSRNYSL